MNIIFERGVYTIEHDGKSYYVNLANKTIVSGATERQVKKVNIAKKYFYDFRNTTNNMMIEALQRVIDYSCGCDNDPWSIDKLNLLANFEKFVNLGYDYDFYELYSFVKEYCRNDETVKQAIKFINKQDKTNNYVRLSDIRTAMFIEVIAQNNPKVDKQFITDNLVELINVCGDQHKLSTCKHLDVIIYYYYTQKLNIMFTDYIYAFRHFVFDYLGMCKYMNKAPVKTSNFAREYTETKETYTRLKEVYDKERFADIYSRLANKALFENDEFTVVFPKEPKDLILEGERMHHCVGGYVNRVLNEETYIVFVRRKNDIDTPYITCQIYLDGTIGQYYLAYDRSIHEDNDIYFKRQYQQFLRANWNK